MKLQQAYIGAGCLQDFVSSLRAYVPRKIFLVRGKSSYRQCGAEKTINDALCGLNVEVLSYSNFEENPKLEDVQKGVSILETFSPEVIIAIGGGSVLDMAKLIRFFHSYVGEPTGNNFIKKKKLIPLFALPTTAGTGCEATHFAVMYKDRVKYSVEHDDILPDYAIVYPPFTYQNPSYLTACTGFDALAQGIEAYWNVNATEESDEYAIKAIQLLWDNLPVAVDNPTEEVRNKVSEGAYWAGRAINITKTTAPHAFSYPFTTYCGYPHGHAVALTFPFFMSLNCLEKENVKYNVANEYHYRLKVQTLKEMLNLDSAKRVDLALKEYLGFLFQCKKNKSDLTHFLSKVNLQRLSNNPIIVDDEIINSLRDYLIKNS